MGLQSIVFKYLGKKILKTGINIANLCLRRRSLDHSSGAMLEDIKAYKITFRPLARRDFILKHRKTGTLYFHSPAAKRKMGQNSTRNPMNKVEILPKGPKNYRIWFRGRGRMEI